MSVFITATHLVNVTELPENFDDFCKYSFVEGTGGYWLELVIDDEHPSIKEAVEGEFDPAVSVMELLLMFGFEGLQEVKG